MRAVVCHTALRHAKVTKLLTHPPSELPPTGAAVEKNVERFDQMVARLASASGRREPGIFLIYPTKDDMAAAKEGRDWLPERVQIERVAKEYGIQVLDLSRMPEWSPDLYRDGVHPSVAGNVLLAKILASAIAEDIRTP